jgi:hypothetical protein
MTDGSDKPVSLVEATRLIYGTAAPSERQIRRVYERMKSGALKVSAYGREPLEWTTSEHSLAEYLAAGMLNRRKTSSAANDPSRPPGTPRFARATSRTRGARKMRVLYNDILRDYVLAVMLRRRMAQRSATFRRAVLFGQITLLLSLVAVFGSVLRFTSEPYLAERVAVERWIDENTQRHQITRWHPTQPAADGNGLIVEVEYRYVADSPRMIHTRRTFRVTGEALSEVLSD